MASAQPPTGLEIDVTLVDDQPDRHDQALRKTLDTKAWSRELPWLAILGVLSHVDARKVTLSMTPGEEDSWKLLG